MMQQTLSIESTEKATDKMSEFSEVNEAVLDMRTGVHQFYNIESPLENRKSRVNDELRRIP
jgi:hypothetical protein